MLITVIIPAYNAAATLPACLAALQRQTLDRNRYEVLVVNDGSTDGTGELARSLGATVIDTRRGRPAAARNAGIGAAQGELICFTDADCEPVPNWLDCLTAPLRKDATIAGSKGSYRTRQRAPIARFVQLEYEEKYDQLAAFKRISMVDTYAASFRRDVLVQNGCFDERYAYAEDRELSYRLAARGHAFIFVPEAAVYHLHAATLGAYLRKKMFNGYWVSQIVRRFPQQGVADAYVPRLQKAQILLAGLICASLPLAIPAQRWVGAATWLIPGGFLALFGATALPFLQRAWRRDRGLVPASLYLLPLRAFFLGLGFMWGLVAPPGRPGPRFRWGQAFTSTGRLLRHLFAHWLSSRS